MVTQAPTSPLVEPTAPDWAKRLVLRLANTFLNLFPSSPVRLWDAVTVAKLPPAADWPGAIALTSGVLWLSNGVSWINAGSTAPPTNVVTPPQFDNSTLIANTAWVNRVGLQFSSRLILSGATTLTASAAGSLVIVTAAAAVTLPLASSFPSGTTISFFSQATGVTVQRTGSDNINTGPTFVSSLTLNIGDTLELVSNGLSAWLANGGSAQLPYSNALANNWPLAPQFDNSGKLATTAWVTRFGNQYSSYLPISVDTALTAAQAAGAIIVLAGAGPRTVTLPPLATMPPGSMITVWGGALGVLQSFSGEPIFTADASGASITTTPFVVGDTAVLTVTPGSTGWVVVSGSIHGYPTQPQFANNPRLATTAFVQRALGNLYSVVGLSANFTLTPFYCGSIMLATGAGGYTITLPLASSMGGLNTATFWFQNSSAGNWTLQPGAGDALYRTNGFVASIVIPSGKFIGVIRGGGTTDWYSFGATF